nr:MAG TPA: Minor capsid protein [Caudoviricetes sp.]DAO15755.1 MAG TPA: Minor capsid protein [Caudoviricetes sp.]
MDLTDRLVDQINLLDLPAMVYAAAVTGKEDPEIGLLVLPNSQVISQDLVGNKVVDFLYEVVMRGTDEGQINNALWKIANLVGSDDFHVESADGSFIYDQAQVSSFPTMTGVDLKGALNYVLDFTIQVETFR